MKPVIRPFIILIVLSLSALSFALKTKDGVVTIDPTWDENVSFINPERTKDYDYLNPWYKQWNLDPQRVNLAPFVTDPLDYTTSVPQPDTTIPIVVIPATVDTEQASQLFKAAVKDLNIMCRLFDNRLKLSQPVNTDPFRNIYFNYRSDQYRDHCLQSFWGRKTRNTDCIYIQGYGALFFMRVGLRLTAPPPPVKPKEKPSEPVDKVWHQIKRELYGPRNVRTDQSGKGYDIDRVEWLKTNIVKNLKHAANVKCLKSDELVIVTANGNEKEAGSPKVLIVRAKKSDIDAFSEGTLDLESFREKVQIVAPPRAKPAKGSEQATGKPDTAEGTEE
jgi:hypothetical protein